MTLFLAAAVGIAGLALWRAVETQPDSDEDETQDDNSALLVPVLAMTFTALLLILGCGFLLFIQDVFKSRINTVFKLYYQAWLSAGRLRCGRRLLAAFEAEDGALQAGQRGPRGVTWRAVALVLVAAALLYPLGGVFSRTEGLATKERSLDALYQARAQSAENVAADRLSGAKTHADRGEVIVEANEQRLHVGRAHLRLERRANRARLGRSRATLGSQHRRGSRAPERRRRHLQRRDAGGRAAAPAKIWRDLRNRGPAGADQIPARRTSQVRIAAPGLPPGADDNLPRPSSHRQGGKLMTAGLQMSLSNTGTAAAPLSTSPWRGVGVRSHKVRLLSPPAKLCHEAFAWLGRR